MGFSSYCQVCGMPLSHTCLIPRDNVAAGTLAIYRRSYASNAPPPPLDLPNWLTEVVALPLETGSPVHTNVGVEDGDVQHVNPEGGGVDTEILADIEDGLGDEYAGVHMACYHLAERPDSLEPIAHIAKSRAYAQVREEFHDQYFDFASVLEDPTQVWRLQDPTVPNQQANQQNLQHIQSLLAITKEVVEKEQADTEEKKISNKPSRSVMLVQLPDQFNSQTLYQWLGLEDSTTTRHDNAISPAELKAAYNRKRKRCHPNAPGGGNAQQYQQVQRAYRVLNTPEWKQAYKDCDFDQEDSRIQFANQVWYSATQDS